MKVNILGTEYTIEKKRYDEEPCFSKRSIDGFCDSFTHQIVYCDMHTYPRWELEEDETIRECEKQTIRHEIVHAFLNESGLDESSHGMDHGWAKNEEMIQWMAIQTPKMMKAFQEANAL